MTPNLKAMFSQHATPNAPGAPQAPAAPSAPGKGPMPSVAPLGGAQPQADYHSLAKKFGVTKLKLDPNPVIARTQLMQHLQTTLGPQYMQHPGVSDLLSSFGQQAQSPGQQNAMDSQAKRTVATLMGK